MVGQGRGGASRTGPRRRVHTLPGSASYAAASYAPQFAADLSEDAATLVYDTPSSQVDPFPSAPEPVSFVRPRALHFSDVQLSVIMLCALIGALAAAWTIEQQGPGAVPALGAVVTELGKLWSADAPAKVAAAMPQPRPAARPTTAASAGPGTSAPAAPEAQPAKTEPEAAPQPAAKAAQPPPAKAEQQAAKRAQPSVAKTAQKTAKVAQPPAADRGKPQRREQKARARTRPSRRAQAEAPAAQSAPALAVPPPANPASGGRTGLLRINSRPWSKVYVDGRAIGSTPQMAIELSPGRHRVALVSDEFDLKRTLTVDIRAGQVVTRTLELMQ